jgi:hypothetical protein
MKVRVQTTSFYIYSTYAVDMSVFENGETRAASNRLNESFVGSKAASVFQGVIDGFEA